MWEVGFSGTDEGGPGMPYLRLLRPHHWLKNLFILLPVPYAMAAGIVPAALPFITGLVAFSLINSAVYAFNDVVDQDRDRVHPDKRKRPIAAREINPRVALVISLSLVIVSFLTLSLVAGWGPVLAIAGTYLGLNLAYSLWGRELPIIDLLLIGSFFFLRILYGCALLEATPSASLLVGGTGIALLLALGKRMAEPRLDLSTEHRRSLQWYSVVGMTRAIRIQVLLVAILYFDYCFRIAPFYAERWWWSLPPVLVGLWQYQYKVLVQGETRSPVDILYRYRSLQILILVWITTTLFSIQFP